MTAAPALHIAWHGAAEPVLLVHGSFVVGREVWQRQLELADAFRVGIVDRRGYGASPPPDGRVDFERDAEDVASLLDEPAHLVGHSYGGVASLLTAARRPDGVRSLTVIEPPAFALAADDPAVRELRARLAVVFERGSDPRTVYADFLEAWGYRRPTEDWLARQDDRALASSATERPPWEAAIPLAVLRGAPFPRLVVSGGWERTRAEARELAGRAFAAVCDVLEHELRAERLIVPGTGHTPQFAGRTFNEPLRRFLRRAREGK